MDKILKFQSNEIIARLETLERERTRSERKMRALKGVCFVLVFALVPLFMSGVPDLLMASIFSVFTALVVFLIGQNRLIAPFSVSFKDEILTLLAHDESLTYERKKFFEFSEFNVCGLFAPNFTIYRGDDFFAGEADGIKFQFCDIFLARANETATKHGKQNSLTTLFYGITLVADFNQNFATTLHVIDSSMTHANSSLMRVSMDNAEFESYFHTHCDDCVSAHYILTPKFMEQLVVMRDYFRAPLSLACARGKAWLYIGLNRNSFEPSINVPLMADNSPVVVFKHELEKFKNLAKILKSNQKAFTETK